MQLHYFSQHAKSAELTRRRIRRAGITPNGHSLWSSDEDNLVKLHYPNFKVLRTKLPNRSYSAIRSRCQTLKVAKKRKQWTAAEESKMRKLYPRVSRSELLLEFPGYSWERIKSKAKFLRLSRPPAPLVPTGFPILDEIKARARVLNISMSELDAMARTGKYFQTASWHSGKNLSGGKVCRAVKALDGSLSVIWNDGTEPNVIALRPELRSAA